MPLSPDFSVVSASYPGTLHLNGVFGIVRGAGHPLSKRMCGCGVFEKP